MVEVTLVATWTRKSGFDHQLGAAAYCLCSLRQTTKPL